MRTSQSGAIWRGRSVSARIEAQAASNDPGCGFFRRRPSEHSPRPLSPRAGVVADFGGVQRAEGGAGIRERAGDRTTGDPASDIHAKGNAVNTRGWGMGLAMLAGLSIAQAQDVQYHPPLSAETVG